MAIILQLVLKSAVIPPHRKAVPSPYLKGRVGLILPLKQFKRITSRYFIEYKGMVAFRMVLSP